MSRHVHTPACGCGAPALHFDGVWRCSRCRERMIAAVREIDDREQRAVAEVERDQAQAIVEAEQLRREVENAR